MRILLAALAAVALLTAQDHRIPVSEIQDQPGLPRVLIVGDSISIGYTPIVRKLLAGKANVHHNPANAGTSGNGVFLMDAWLGAKQKWDVIHFNFGLHDLKRMADGQHQVSPEQYERYLRLFTQRAKQTGAKLIFATTTPVPEGKVNPPRVPADVTIYNDIAKRVMRENNILINDLYTVALPKLAEWQEPVNVHYKPVGYEGLAERVASAIRAQLPQ